MEEKKFDLLDFKVTDLTTHVTGDVAAEDQVEAKDAEAGDDAAPADPGVLRGQLFVAAHDALTGLTAEGHFADHHAQAHEYGQAEVDDEEGEAAALAHLEREAPNVAQTDGRADGRHQESEVGGKSSAVLLLLFHTFLSLLKTNRPVFRPGRPIAHVNFL